MWVVALTDPDGYRLDFESPTEAQEESELEEAG
jgi:lactoylglutathione lyase